MKTILAAVGLAAIVLVALLFAGAIWALWKFEGRGRW